MDRKLTENDIQDLSLEAIRRTLGNLTVKWAEEMKGKDTEEMSEEDRLNRAKGIRYVYENYLEKELDHYIWLQTKLIAEQASSERMLDYQRGVIAGIYLIKEWLEDEVKVAISEADENKEEESADIDTNL